MSSGRSNQEEEKKVPLRSSTSAIPSHPEDSKQSSANPPLTEPSPDLYDYGIPPDYENDRASESASVLTLYLSQNDNHPENNGGDSENQEGEPEDEEEQKRPADFLLGMRPSGDTEDDYGGMRAESRAMTAPARPQTEIEQFRKSRSFIVLENAAIYASQLIQRADNKFDLDSPEGQNSCKKFLEQIEQMCVLFKASCCTRGYRSKFSQAYKILYKDGSLCYLTEILDSAQEGFPYLWVNSEKYIFTAEVLKAGEQVFDSFCKTKQYIRNMYNRICEENAQADIARIITEFKQLLEEFDLRWTTFEQLYVMELMLIESDARRHILKAIELDKELLSFEQRERMKGKLILNSEEYNELRRKFVAICCQINSVANPEGKGRDDLSVDILIAAESISRRISSSLSKALRKLTDEIKKTFNAIRTLLRKYDENIEVVDPQLKNNPELVEVLMPFEKAWEKGKEFLTSPKRCNQLIYLSQLIEGATEKYAELQDKIDCVDSELFVLFPCLVVLNSLDGDDKGICKAFYPLLEVESHPERVHYEKLKACYEALLKKANKSFELYSMLEQTLLDKPLLESQLKSCNVTKDEILKLVHDMKRTAMGLQRHKPLEWNSFLETAMGQAL